MHVCWQTQSSFAVIADKSGMNPTCCFPLSSSLDELRLSRQLDHVSSSRVEGCVLICLVETDVKPVSGTWSLSADFGWHLDVPKSFS